ncbi:GNAT family N-acetyltransferase [Solicola sp. PLA-1-18]|uniref:GNAT family N-acetyltransferase n=1 Tax=Solicola sp. PLA-1-18 TaxID=3380532 RepID=UPI003B7AE231
MSPTADVSVRVAWSADAEAVAWVQVRAWREAYADVMPADVLEALVEDDVADAWRGSMARPGDARNRVLVALERANVRGFAVTAPSGDPDADPVADGEVSELVVHPDHRGAGHGSRLLQAASETLAADGFRRASMWVPAAADDLRAFVTGTGWAADGAHRELALDAEGEVTLKQVRLHTSLVDEPS